MPTSAPTKVDPITVIDWMTDADAVTVLDVRSPVEFETTHIAGSYNQPLDQARQRLAGTGMNNLHVLKAGDSGFAVAGGHVVHGRPRWSLDRQVRLVAGLTASAATDTCTMGRLLPALPYNRGTQADPQKLLDQLPTPEPAAV